MSSVHDGPPRADVSRGQRPPNPPPRPDWPVPSPADLPIDILVARLEGVRESSAGQFSALCPSHGDSRPSLSISETEDHTVLVLCHAGCRTEKVLEAVGLKLRHLYPSNYSVWHFERYGRPPIAIGSAPRRPDRTMPAVEYTPSADLARVAEAAHRAAVIGGGLQSLAQLLELPEPPLHWLDVGVMVHQQSAWWTFAERDGSGTVVGVLLRHGVTGDKTSLQGGRRGLYLPSVQPAAPPAVPFVVPEGATDLVALLGAGCPGVGRPAARPTGHVIGWLVAWLQAHPEAWAGRPVVVCGDNDPAGRDGAAETARALAAVVPGVTTAFPPDGHKDMRAWIASGTFDPAMVLAQRTSTNTQESP